MIIKYPTGLYASVLPRSETDGGNVTYTISSTKPPRAELAFIKVPVGVVNKRRTSIINPNYDYRQNYGNLIFTVTTSEKSDEGNSDKQYELGEISDFNNISGKSVDQMLVSKSTEIRHDTNVIDYAKLGLNDEEVAALDAVTYGASQDLADRLNTARQLRADLEVEINTQQKIINDTTRAIDGLTASMDTGAITGSLGTEGAVVESIINKLKLKRDDAFKARDEAINSANSVAVEAAALADQFRIVGTLVK